MADGDLGVRGVTDEARLVTPAAYLAFLAHAATYDFAGRHVSGRVLDLGCGPGDGTRRLAGYAAEVTGADISQKVLERAATRHAAPNLDWRCVDEAVLPFPDGGFDAVVSANVIEHVASVEPYLAEVRRVLRPGGTFWCATPDRRGRLYPGRQPWNRRHLREYDPAGLVSALSPGFGDVRTFTVTAPPQVIDVARAEYRALRWASHPFTFPGAPEWWRLRGLRLVETLVAGGRPQERASRFPFGADDVRVVPGTERGHTLLVSARRA